MCSRFSLFSMKRALLINPPTGQYIRDDRCQVPVKGLSSSLRMPLDLAYMAAALESVGVECLIRDYPAVGGSADLFFADLETFRPEALFVSATTPTLERDLAICRQAKDLYPALLIVIKGAQFTVEAKQILPENRFLDVAIKNECELAAREIGEGKSLAAISGLAYRQGAMILETAARPYLENLDELPFPARHLLNNALYVRPDTLEPQTSILASRGCPRGCMFCLVGTVSGTKVNSRSPESIIQEMKECLIKYKINNFYFRADTFTWNREWVSALCQRIIKAKMKVYWVCNSRVDTVDRALLEEMKSAGCWMIGFGVESGDQGMLDEMGKGATLAQTRVAVQWCRDSGIKTYLFFIYGLPGETAGSLDKTLRFALALDGDFAEFHQAYPFPGTKFHDFALEKGLFRRQGLPGKDVFNSPATSFTLTREELESFGKRAKRRFYSRGKFIWRRIKEIKNWKILVNYIRKGMDIFFDL